jgi:hypothetical protein
MVLILAMAAAPALAETYKWVDAKGVVTYSDTPPPSMAAKPQVVAERVSVMPPDPTFTAAAAALEARLARRAQYEEADYARRQQYMLEAQLTQMNYAAAADAYAEAAYAPYYGYGGWGYAGGAGRRGHRPHVSPYRNYWDYPVYPAAYRSGGGTVYGGRAPSTRGASHSGRGRR